VSREIASGEAQQNPIIKAVDLFCGVGGLTHGLIRGGVSVVAGIDIDGSCRYAYEANNRATFIEKDVNNVEAWWIKETFGTSDFTLLAGCAPCQPFSTYSQSGREDRLDSDWQLVSSFGRLVKEVQPHFVTMENVPRLTKHTVFEDFLTALGDYHIEWSIVECSRVGVPQSRNRLVLLASRIDSKGLKLPTSCEAAITVRDTISHLPALNAGQADASDPLHVACRLSELNLRRIRLSKPGGSWRDWDIHVRAACHLKKTGDTYPSVYGRMEWDVPAPTITTQCFGYGNGRFGHPEQDRAITLREAAMLQTFPANYVFIEPGERLKFSRMGRLIGNAVPVRLGEVIASTFLNHARTHMSAAVVP
jgi:DNA (cytosine-5)-methyltransferase 1